MSQEGVQKVNTADSGPGGKSNTLGEPGGMDAVTARSGGEVQYEQEDDSGRWGLDDEDLVMDLRRNWDEGRFSTLIRLSDSELEMSLTREQGSKLGAWLRRLKERCFGLWRRIELRYVAKRNLWCAPRSQFVAVNQIMCFLFPGCGERVDANHFTPRTHSAGTQTLVHLTHLDVLARARDDACAPTVSGESPNKWLVQFSPPPTPPDAGERRALVKRRRLDPSKAPPARPRL
jgi:hypothetical protein